MTLISCPGKRNPGPGATPAYLSAVSVAIEKDGTVDTPTSDMKKCHVRPCSAGDPAEIVRGQLSRGFRPWIGFSAPPRSGAVNGWDARPRLLKSWNPAPS